MRLNDWRQDAEQYRDIDRAIQRTLEERMDKLETVTDALLTARNNLQVAQGVLFQRQKEYNDAEEAFLTGAGAVAPGAENSEWPDKVLVGNLVIIAVDEWWDAKKGARLEYHTVQAVPA